MSLRGVREPLESTLEPWAAVLALRGDERPFALVGAWAGVGAVLGSAPLRVLGAGEDPFAALGDLPAVEAGDAVVGGGWFGVLGYGLGGLVERLPPPPPAPLPQPLHRLAYYDHVVVFDGERWWFESLVEDHPRLGVWRERLAGAHPRRSFSAGGFTAVAPGAAGHRAAVAACVARIGEGELFQANLALRLEAPFAGDALDLFSVAGATIRPRFGACFDGVVSLSPERFLRRVGRHVESEPIKGTSADPAALAASAKDAAEHVMIVDLMRNDLGRVCAYGSIAASEPRVEAYAGVHHMVSTVAGELRPGATDGDLLRATFPPGSVTGAPKVQAMKVIAALEATRREAYTGAIGFASPIAGLELSVAIRTFELAEDRIWLGAGGGIVADSDPEAELAEALAKAAGPLAALPTTVERTVDHRLRGELPARRIERALEHGNRPDPALGLLETIRVAGGAAQELDAHLARLTASARALYGIAPPPGLRERVEAIEGDRRVRVVLLPDGTASVEPAPLAGRHPPQAFAPYLLPGGLGRHKWADRRLVDALTQAAPAGTLPLLVDADGLVLEASYTNVWIEDDDGALLTPPVDGRILPGVTRARILSDHPGAREAPITLAALEGAHGGSSAPP